MNEIFFFKECRRAPQIAAANLTTGTKVSRTTRGHQVCARSARKQSMGPHCSPVDHDISYYFYVLKCYLHCSYDLYKILRLVGLSKVLLKELPHEGYNYEKYIKIGRYIALEKFRLNLIVMELTKARFSNESIFWKGKSCTKLKRRVVTYYQKRKLTSTSSKRKCHCFMPLLVW